MSFTSIPNLDLSRARDPLTKTAFLAELRHVLIEVGFMYISNTGIPDGLWEDIVSQGIEFFRLPEDEKYASDPSVRAVIMPPQGMDIPAYETTDSRLK